MKTNWMRLTAFALVAAWIFPMTAQAGDRVRYQFQVFRLTGRFEHKTAQEEALWGGDAAEWDKIKDEVTIFDNGAFQLGSDLLRIDRDGCSWNDRKLTFEEGLTVPLPEEKIKLIYSPNILKREGELVRMKIESRQLFEHMDQRDDGLFELKKTTLPVGMDIEVRAEREARDVFRISRLKLDLRTVNGREEAKGTRLPVGRPLLREFEYILQLIAREQKNFGVLLQPKGTHVAFIIRIEVDDN